MRPTEPPPPPYFMQENALLAFSILSDLEKKPCVEFEFFRSQEERFYSPLFSPLTEKILPHPRGEQQRSNFLFCSKFVFKFEAQCGNACAMVRRGCSLIGENLDGRRGPRSCGSGCWAEPEGNSKQKRKGQTVSKSKENA